MYLLDTNIISDLMRRPHGRVAERVRSVGFADLCTSVVVAGELRYGAAKRNAARLTQRLTAVLGELPILPIEVPIDAVYGRLRAALEQRGQPINDPDYWIAAQALAGDHILVTDDSDFVRIPELKRENWLVLD
jgi:tRNA(fMet)-specific endonuclease VapC